MPDLITPNNLNKSSQLWIVARMFSAIVFLVSAFIYSDVSYRLITKRILLTATLTITGLVFICFIYYPSYLPATFVEGAGLTPLKIYSEYVINAILGVALIAYWKRFSRAGEQIYVYFMAALIINIFSELAFTLYNNAFDTYNILGHIYKIIVFLLICHTLLY
jgi:sigma-B regulation protein RsbU (phosphoserine phosphatase)